MYALDFEYAGEKLSDYGMMICRFDVWRRFPPAPTSHLDR